MLKKIIKKWISGIMAVMILLGTGVFADVVDYGAAGASQRDYYSIEDMLIYAIQDEYLAKTEYEMIIEQFGEQRPFTNIIPSEEYHISLLTPLFSEYDIDLPQNTASAHVIIPDALDETFEIGVKAEIDNIGMYEKFLEQDNLPEDIREVFEVLKRASQNHLKAFERGTSRGTGRNTSTGNNRGRNRRNK